VPEPLPSSAKEKPAVTNNLDLQSHEQKPHWQGKELRVAVGAITETDQQMAVAFSVLNASTRTIELLPPQIQLAGTSRKRHGRPVKAEPIAIKEYTITGRRLLPGASANAVVLFERRSFKESAVQLLLRIAQGEEVDRPVVVPIAFVAPVEGGEK
jgi:hypothetical protein